LQASQDPLRSKTFCKVAKPRIINVIEILWDEMNCLHLQGLPTSLAYLTIPLMNIMRNGSTDRNENAENEEFEGKVFDL
jgi:hypothetical protein